MKTMLSILLVVIAGFSGAAAIEAIIDDFEDLGGAKMVCCAIGAVSSLGILVWVWLP